MRTIGELVRDFLLADGVASVEATTGVRTSAPLLRRIVRAVVAGAVVVPLAACGTTGQRHLSDGQGRGHPHAKEIVGTVLGAGAGGLAGSRFGQGGGKLAMVGVGTLVGAALGGRIGASLDRADAAYMREAEQMSHRSGVGHTVQWENPRSGHYGTITPVRSGHTADGEPCREYHVTVVGGGVEEAYVTVCRKPDGRWAPLSSWEGAPSAGLFASVDEDALGPTPPGRA